MTLEYSWALFFHRYVLFTVKPIVYINLTCLTDHLACSRESGREVRLLLVHLRALWSQLVPTYRDSGSTLLSTWVNLLVSLTHLMSAINAVLPGTLSAALPIPAGRSVPHSKVKLRARLSWKWDTNRITLDLNSWPGSKACAKCFGHCLSL